MAKHVRITDAERNNFMPTMDVPGNAGYVHLTDGTNVLSVYPTGALKVTDTADGPVDPGTAATNSQLAGGVYNPNNVSLSSGQQTALQLDQRGFLKTTLADTNSDVSTLNSTSTPLGSDAVFTGTGEEVKDYASIVIQVYSSHASATNGLQIQFSLDNSNWDRTIRYTIPAATGKSFIEAPRARYMRIVYTNGATLQTGFRLQTIFHYNAVNSRHTTVDQAVASDDAAVLTRGFITNGTYNTDVYPTGALKVTDTADGPVAPGAQAANSSLVGAVYNSAGISLLDAQQSSMQMDNTGNLKVTVSGAILANPVAGASVLSTVNSTSTPLLANGTFTGSGELCIDYASIVIQLYSSHASATGGLQVQFSTNNTNWDKAVTYTVSATTPENYIEFPRARYMRIVYTNGATLQTAFRLQTIFHYSPVNARHTTLDATLNTYETCLLGRHAIVGFDPTTNAPYNAKVNSAGQLLVATAGASGPSTTEATESVSKRAYQTTITIQLPTTNEYAMILFNNPTGSGKTVYVRNITFANTTGANKSVTLKVYSAPTVTVAGTALSPTTMYVGSNAAVTSTTVTYNNIGLQGNNNVTQTMTVTNFGTALSSMVATNETSNIDYNWGLLVSPNNRILVTALAAANNQNTTINIIWTEV